MRETENRNAGDLNSAHIDGRMNHGVKTVICLFILVFFVLCFFKLTETMDNKYALVPPFGEGGIIKISEKDLERGSPIFLIDGWEVYNGSVRPEKTSSLERRITFIGEHSNYAYLNRNEAPTGEASYRIAIDYSGEGQIAKVMFPELASDFRLWVNGNCVDEGSGNAGASFMLTEGISEILINVKSHGGYYSGMYFPGAISIPETIDNWIGIKTMCYAAVFFMTLTLALFSLRLWKDRQTKVYRMFGLICIAFALYLSYHFIHLVGFPFAGDWYAVEDCAFYLLVFLMMRLNFICAKLEDRRIFKAVTLVSILFPIISMGLYFMVAYIPEAVQFHNALQNVYRVLVCLILSAVSLHAFIEKVSEYRFLLAGNMVFGIGLVINILESNKFEPIYTFWQFEWCGIFLVIVFAAMITERNKRIIRENQQLTENLESIVESRTQKLQLVLEERRHFFSAMAHDLKAPLSATQSFIKMIKSHHVEVDKELTEFIDQVEAKQNEMRKRVESLNTITKMDKIVEKSRTIGVNEFLNKVYRNFVPEAEVLGIHLKLEVADREQYVAAQEEKLVIAMENLIYNAFSFTPEDGIITIGAEVHDREANIYVSDTGVGVPEDKLPLLFNRFYVGRQNQSEGSGLGLYIVKLIVEEMGGRAEVESILTKGSTFTMILPKVDKQNFEKTRKKHAAS